jgi:hypothetical protein
VSPAQRKIILTQIYSIAGRAPRRPTSISTVLYTEVQIYRGGAIRTWKQERRAYIHQEMREKERGNRRSIPLRRLEKAVLRHP